MTPSRTGVRPWLVLMVAAGAIFVLAGLIAFLPLAFQEPAATADPAAASSGSASTGSASSGSGVATSGAARPATQAEADAALAQAAAALQAGDKAAYREALPAAGKPARHALGALFRHLSPLPWSSFAFVARPIQGVPGRYDVYATGRLGRTGPDDRVAGERVLDLEVRDGRVTAVADQTPAAVERQYLMAFRDPVSVQRNGVLVIADRSSKGRAEELADAAQTAVPRLSLVGVKPSDEVLVAVYSSLEDLKASFGGDVSEDRIRFFSNVAPRLAAEPWRLRDVGVLGPSLDGTGAWMPLMLSHELTHAYTGRWFADTAHSPTFLMEGLATAVEGGRDWAPLQEEVATGNQLWPLVDAIGTGDLWMGTSTEDVRLAYLEAASLVHYVLDRWGLAKLRPFVQAVADSDLTADGLDAAVRDSLGVSWDEFYRGWQEYVPTLQ